MKVSFEVKKELVQKFYAECKQNGLKMVPTLNDIIEQWLTCREGARGYLNEMHEIIRSARNEVSEVQDEESG
jgi:hypothetical protein